MELEYSLQPTKHTFKHGQKCLKFWFDRAAVIMRYEFGTNRKTETLFPTDDTKQEKLQNA